MSYHGIVSQSKARMMRPCVVLETLVLFSLSMVDDSRRNVFYAFLMLFIERIIKECILLPRVEMHKYVETHGDGLW